MCYSHLLSHAYTATNHLWHLALQSQAIKGPDEHQHEVPKLTQAAHNQTERNQTKLHVRTPERL